LFPNLLVIKLPTETTTDSADTIVAYQPSDDPTDPLAQPIPAYIEKQPATSGEQRYIQLTIVRGEYAAALQGYYPTINGTMHASIDDIDYNIVDIAHDPTKTYTLLGMELIG
jgi:hypothetical protein